MTELSPTTPQLEGKTIFQLLAFIGYTPDGSMSLRPVGQGPTIASLEMAARQHGIKHYLIIAQVTLVSTIPVAGQSSLLTSSN